MLELKPECLVCFSAPGAALQIEARPSEQTYTGEDLHTWCLKSLEEAHERCSAEGTTSEIPRSRQSRAFFFGRVARTRLHATEIWKFESSVFSRPTWTVHVVHVTCFIILCCLLAPWLQVRDPWFRPHETTSCALEVDTSPTFALSV